MAGWFDNLTGAFDARDPGSYPALQMRQKLALAQIAGNKKGYPKTVGEGLTAVGDAIGERSQVNQMLGQQAAYDAYVRAHAPPDAATLLNTPGAAAPAAAAPRTSSDAGDTVAAPVQTADAAAPAAAPPSWFDTAVANNADYQPTPEPADTQTADAGPANPVQASQLSTLLGTGANAVAPASAPLASLDPSVVPPTATPNPAVRNSLAATLNGQGVPQPNPTAGAVPAALSTSPGSPASAPLPQDLGSPPEAADNRPIPFQLAQAGPAPGIPQINRITPPVRMPPTGEPKMPDNEPMNAAEIEGLRQKQLGARLQDPSIAQQGQILYDAGKAKREKQDADNMEMYRQRVESYRQRATAQESAERGAPLAQQQLDKATAEANIARAGDIITKNTGLPPQAVMDDFKTRLPAADRDVSLLRNARIAKQMIETGVVSGVGANLRVDLARARALWGNIPESELASRSERALAATKAMVGYGLNQYQPGDTRVTNSDTIVSGQIVGGDASQQLQTRKELVNMVIQDSNRRVADYEQRHGIAFEGTPAGEMYRLRTDPIHDDPKIAAGALTILLTHPEDAYNRQKFDEHFGPGSAELEIARAERRAKRRQ